MERETPDLRATLQALRTRRVLIAFCVLLGMGVALAWSLRQPDTYAASSRVVVRPIVPDAAFGRSVRGGVLGIDFSVETQSKILGSEAVAERVIDRLRLDVTAEALIEDDIRVAELTDETLEITASASAPGSAARIANTFVEEYLTFRQETANKVIEELAAGLAQRQLELATRANELDVAILEAARTAAKEPPERAELDVTVERLTSERNQLLEELGVVRARSEELGIGQRLVTTGGDVVKRATPPENPASPQPLRDGAAGAIIGLLAGLGLAMFRAQTDDRIRTHAEATWAAGVPVIATVPRIRGWRRNSDAYLVTVKDPGSPAAEAYRTIRQTMAAMGRTKSINSVVVTSGGPGAGKSSTAANLAVACAQAGLRTALVSADLRRPRLHEFFNVPNDAGLGPMLAGKDGRVILHHPDIDNLRIYTSGPATAHAGELLDHGGVESILDKLSADADVVILDAPPLASGADPLVLAAHCDLTVLCMRQSRALGRATAAAVEELHQAGADRVVGVLTVASTRGDGRGYGYGARYDYRASDVGTNDHTTNGQGAPSGIGGTKDVVLVNTFPPRPRERSRDDGDPGVPVHSQPYRPARRWFGRARPGGSR